MIETATRAKRCWLGIRAGLVDSFGTIAARNRLIARDAKGGDRSSQAWRDGFDMAADFGLVRRSGRLVRIAMLCASAATGLCIALLAHSLILLAAG